MFTSWFNPQAPPLEVATDGSVLNQQDTFGWPLSTDMGTHLVTCSSPVYRCTPTSYHNEFYGLLSLLRFLLQLHLYTGTPTQKIEIHMESESLISKISQMTRWNINFSAVTLQPEWDMLQAILSMLKKLSTHHQHSHIKSNQDDNHEYESLTLATHPNVDADQLAGSYHLHIPPNPTMAPIITDTTAQLNLNTGTITSYLHLP